MRAPLVVLVVLSACSSTPGPAGPKGDPGVGADPVALMALTNRIAELESQVAAVKPAKVPWFVDGETKEPIGRVLDYGDRIAWNEDVGAPLPALPVQSYYAEPDCRGEARVAGTTTRYVALADGRIVDVSAPRAPLAIVSSLRPGVPCAPYLDPAPDYLYAFTVTGATVAATTAKRIAVELR